MPPFRPGTLARVPFPYTDRPARQHRPAIVVATGLGAKGDMMWVVMITSAENRRWPGDIPLLDDYGQVGLTAPSLIRTEKISVIDAGLAEWKGDFDAVIVNQVLDNLARYLGRAA